MGRVSGRLIAALMAISLLGGAALSQENLELLASRLNAGDLAVLVTALMRPASRMMTTEGSANDAFWSALEKRGLMQQHPLPADMARELKSAGVAPKIFSVTEEGHAELPDLLARLAGNDQ
jgi:hypothetical protein